MSAQPVEPSSGRSTLLVDGNCIVCDVEMSHYKKIAPELFELVDISQPEFDAAKFGLTAEAVNKHIHVMTPSGEVLKAIQAFAHIWSRIPRYQKVSRFIMLPVIRHLARAGYEVFVLIRPWLPKKK